MLFMTFFLAIMEFGWAVFNYNFVSYAAREGARYASTRGSQCQSPCTQATTNIVQAFIRNEAVAMDTSLVAVTTTYAPNNTPGNQVTVNVSYPIPALLGWLTGGATITASSTMRIAQ
jgi:Flp pilus assembly protein TadG